jgi:hypothetical protein
LLLVHHLSDRCERTPFGDAARLSEQYPLISVFGGAAPRSGPCQPFSQHGFGQGVRNSRPNVNWMLKKPFSQEVK